MSELDRDEFENEPIERRRSRRRVFWLGLGLASLAAAITSAIAIGGSSEARAVRGWLGHDHGGHGRRDPARVREHAELAAEGLLRWVDASDAQQARVREIVGGSLEQLLPLAEQHREHHAAIVKLLAQPTIDRAELESLRAQELALADAASRTLVSGLADVAEALTPEQRAELLELASRFRH